MLRHLVRGGPRHVAGGGGGGRGRRHLVAVMEVVVEMLLLLLLLVAVAMLLLIAVVIAEVPRRRRRRLVVVRVGALMLLLLLHLTEVEHVAGVVVLLVLWLLTRMSRIHLLLLSIAFHFVDVVHGVVVGRGRGGRRRVVQLRRQVVHAGKEVRLLHEILNLGICVRRRGGRCRRWRGERRRRVAPARRSSYRLLRLVLHRMLIHAGLTVGGAEVPGRALLDVVE